MCKLKLIEVVPDKRLVYQVVDNYFNCTKDKTEWVNTMLLFEIYTEDDKTRMQFTNRGLTPEYYCNNACYNAWTNYINKSLYNYIMKGKRQPNPKEGDGF